MDIEQLGYNEELEDFRIRESLVDFAVGRVVIEHKERYSVIGAHGEFDCELLGSLRFMAQDRSDLPAVGDWVAFSPYDEKRALIHAIFPRKTALERKAVGKYGEKQLIASNIDCVLIVQSVDSSFNSNRIERYLQLASAAHISATIVLSKVDLITEKECADIVHDITQRFLDIPVLTVSSCSNTGYTTLINTLVPGKSYSLLGSSGVGKSTLLNALLGREKMVTSSIGETTKKGRHTTTHRELTVLDSGVIIIDNPGMREVGVVAADSEEEYHIFSTLVGHCKFSDCTHVSEVGCAILEAVNSGVVDKVSYENFLRLQREEAYFEMSVVEKRKRDKGFGKMVKSMKKDITQVKGKYRDGYQ